MRSWQQLARLQSSFNCFLALSIWVCYNFAKRAAIPDVGLFCRWKFFVFPSRSHRHWGGLCSVLHKRLLGGMSCFVSLFQQVLWLQILLFGS